MHIKGVDGGYMERNDSWYISAHNGTYNLTCKYNSFDEFMNKYFSNYSHIEWIRFTPGSQYIVTKEQCLFYPKSFWESLMNELNINRATEGHIIERALYMIFNNSLLIKEI